MFLFAVYIIYLSILKCYSTDSLYWTEAKFFKAVSQKVPSYLSMAAGDAWRASHPQYGGQQMTNEHYINSLRPQSSGAVGSPGKPLVDISNIGHRPHNDNQVAEPPQPEAETDDGRRGGGGSGQTVPKPSTTVAFDCPQDTNLDKFLDALQIVLGVSSFVLFWLPGASLALDIIDAIISFARGNIVAGVISLVFMAIPLAGLGIKTVLKKLKSVEAVVEILVIKFGKIIDFFTTVFSKLFNFIVDHAKIFGTKIVEGLKKISNNFLGHISNIAAKFVMKKPNPLLNIKYTDKVLSQMKNIKDKYHSFPILVDNFGSDGIISYTTNRIGEKFMKVEILGNVNGVEGMYEYIINLAGECNHRLFVPF